MKKNKQLLKQVSEKWGQSAESWAENVAKGHDIYREKFNNPNFFKFIGDIKGKKILDAGCGEGHNTRLFAKAGASLTGIDIAPQMITHAQKEEAKLPLGISYKITAMSDLSEFSDESFDIVLSTMALMDGPDYEGSVKEFFRVLKPGGSLFFSICHPCFMTKGYGWLNEQELGENQKLLVSDYFEKEPWINRWKFSHNPDNEQQKLFEPLFFSRTISEYVNALIELGFILKKLAEPQPSKELAKEYPSFQKWRTAAPFLYMHAQKP